MTLQTYHILIWPPILIIVPTAIILILYKIKTKILLKKFRNKFDNIYIAESVNRFKALNELEKIIIDLYTLKSQYHLNGPIAVSTEKNLITIDLIHQSDRFNSEPIEQKQEIYQKITAIFSPIAKKTERICFSQRIDIYHNSQIDYIQIKAII